MFDPECFSPFLEKLVKKFKKIDKDLLAFDIAHMPSNISEIVNLNDGQTMLNILIANKIDYAQ